MPYFDQAQNWLADYPYAVTLLSLAALFLLAWIANFIVRRVLLRIAERVVAASSFKWDDALLGRGVLSRLAHAVPALVIAGGIGAVPGLHPAAVAVIGNVALAYVALTIALSISNLLDAVNDLYVARSPKARERPIKGYLQVVKIIIFVLAAVLMVAALIERSPLLLLSGFGAMSAVLMLVFKDSILSLVASVQLSSNDMMRVGDWIEMPSQNADGDVIDMALHTVKVQNWDKTITTIPTYKMISESFKNWRGMSESGGRRIKRAVYLDQASVRFLDERETEHFKRFALLTEYVKAKTEELERIHASVTRRVRQLAPGPRGLPIEIYCFTRTVVWSEYESIQSDIFDHIIAIVPEFGLRLFQEPSGADIAAAAAALQPAAGQGVPQLRSSTG